MKSQATLFWLAVLFLFCGTATFWIAWRRLRATNASSAGSHQVADQGGSEPLVLEPLDEFTLTDQSGQEFCSTDLSGKVWILSFFYTSCPSVCRMQNTMVANLQRDYQETEVHFVSITCDPQTDTPAVLTTYAEFFSFDPQRWHFLTGPFEYIQRIGPKVQTVVKKEIHSDRLFVLDREGKVRGGFRSTDPDQMMELKELVDQLLADTVEPLADTPPAEDGGEDTGAVD